MFGLGLPELFLILVLVLVIFGPRRLPQLGQAIGASIKGFKRGTAGDDLPAVPDTKDGMNSSDGQREVSRPGEMKESSHAHV